MRLNPGYSQLFPASKLEDISYAIKAANAAIGGIQNSIDFQYAEVTKAAMGMNYGHGGAFKQYDEAHKKINSLFATKSLLERKVKGYEDEAKSLLVDRSKWETVSNTIW